MNFTELIKNKIYPILKELEFSIKEEYNNVKFGSYIEFYSGHLLVIINYNSKEKSCSIYIGDDNSTYELTDIIIHDIFGIDASLSKQSDINIFTERLYTLLKNDKVQEMLKGNIKDLVAISMKKASEYSANMLFEQDLNKLSGAWNKKDYVLFIRIIDTLDINALPKSYQLKYQIAKKKI